MRQSVSDLEYVRVPVTITDPTTGNAVDPTMFDVSMAFTADQIPLVGGETFYTAEWVVTPTGWSASCLVGPGGTVVLPKGNYAIFVAIANSPQDTIKQSGPLTIY